MSLMKKTKTPPQMLKVKHEFPILGCFAGFDNWNCTLVLSIPIK